MTLPPFSSSDAARATSCRVLMTQPPFVWHKRPWSSSEVAVDWAMGAWRVCLFSRATSMNEMISTVPDAETVFQSLISCASQLFHWHPYATHMGRQHGSLEMRLFRVEGCRRTPDISTRTAFVLALNRKRSILEYVIACSRGVFLPRRHPSP